MRWSFGDPDAMLTRTMPSIRWMFTRWFAVASIALFASVPRPVGESLAPVRRGVVVDLFVPRTSAWQMSSTLWIIGGLCHPDPRARPRLRVQVFRRRSARARIHARLLSAGVLLQCVRRVELSRSRRPALGNGGRRMDPDGRRQRCGGRVVGGRPRNVVAEMALAAMLVGGVTTLFTNANPLLPLDGYFALIDWLEIPNLRHRAFAHFQWWVKRVVFGLDVPEPPASFRERRVFLVYGALAFVYIVALFVLSRDARARVGRPRTRHARCHPWAWGALAPAAETPCRVGPRGDIGPSRAWLYAKSFWQRGLIGFAAILVVLALVPWTLTSPGQFVVHPLSTQVVTAPDSGIIAQVFVAEGMHVSAGAPLVRLVDRALEREILAAGRAIDSLTVSESAARSIGRTGDASRLTAERTSAVAALNALERRVASFTLRAAFDGSVATARPEDLVGRRTAAGDSLLALATLDSVELRVALRGAGATRVQSGQMVHAISYADPSEPWSARVSGVSSAGVSRDSAGGWIEARVRRSAAAAWRPGTVGEASVELGRSNVLGALWWKARQLLRDRSLALTSSRGASDGRRVTRRPTKRGDARRPPFLYSRSRKLFTPSGRCNRGSTGSWLRCRSPADSRPCHTIAALVERARPGRPDPACAVLANQTDACRRAAAASKLPERLLAEEHIDRRILRRRRRPARAIARA